MQIESIRNIGITNTGNYNKTNTRQNPVFASPNIISKDKVSFTGNYQEQMIKYAKSGFKNMEEATTGFAELFKLIRENPEIVTNRDFEIINNIYLTEGFHSLLRRLMMFTQDKQLSKILSDENPCVLATQNNNPLLHINVWGPSRFLDCFKSTNQIPHHTEISFDTLRPNFHISYNLTPKGLYEINTSNETSSLFAEYYNTTGGVRKTVHQIYGGQPDTTYFNEDGSKPFFKNWIFGGTPMPPM